LTSCLRFWRTALPHFHLRLYDRARDRQGRGVHAVAGRGESNLRRMHRSHRRWQLVATALLAAALFAVASAVAATQTGTNGDDKLRGSEQSDSIDAGAGDDYVAGLGGDDTLNGGPDSDSIDGGAGNDKVYGGSAEYGGQGLGRYIDNPGKELLLGGDGNDLVLANACIQKGCSGDTYIALDSTLEGNAGDDVVTGGNQDDVITGGDGHDTLTGLAGNDRLDGGTGDDRVDGGAGNDVLRGGAGSDTLDGGDGNDRMIGGSGQNLLMGGAGNDRFSVRNGKRDRVDCGPGKDQVSADKRDVLRHCERVRRSR
jgi:Ca2+-binding RTX toxin-like protein